MRALRNKKTGEWLLDEDKGYIPYTVSNNVTLQQIHNWGWWENNQRIDILNDYELVEIEIIVTKVIDSNE